MKQTLFLLIFFAIYAPLHAQRPLVPPSPSPGGPFVLLRSGDTLFSSRIRIFQPDTADKYLVLDNNRHLPIGEVQRIHNRSEELIPVPGSAGTDLYRIEREGPKLSLYSRLLFDPVHRYDSGYQASRIFYYRKPGQVTMHEASYKSLSLAMSDNPQSVQQLKAARTATIWTFMTLGASSVVTALGIFQSLRRHTISSESPPLAPGLPPTTTYSFSKPSFSPLVVVGIAGFGATVIVGIGAKKHALKAFELYNQ